MHTRLTTDGAGTPWCRERYATCAGAPAALQLAARHVQRRARTFAPTRRNHGQEQHRDPERARRARPVLAGHQGRQHHLRLRPAGPRPGHGRVPRRGHPEPDAPEPHQHPEHPGRGRCHHGQRGGDHGAARRHQRLRPHERGLRRVLRGALPRPRRLRGRRDPQGRSPSTQSQGSGAARILK